MLEWFAISVNAASRRLPVRPQIILELPLKDPITPDDIEHLKRVTVVQSSDRLKSGGGDPMGSAPRKPKEDARYANFFQVGYNAFEFLLEFGQREGRIHTAIYVSPQHAKILSELLLGALREYDEGQGATKAPSSIS